LLTPHGVERQLYERAVILANKLKRIGSSVARVGVRRWTEGLG
jgi:hypothetical protein